MFGYFVDDRGVVMIKCGGFTIGLAVSRDWEREVEEEALGDGGAGEGEGMGSRVRGWELWPGCERGCANCKKVE